SVFGFVDGTISFSFKQQTVDVDLDGNGTIDLVTPGTAWARGPPGTAPGPDLHDATLTTLGLRIPGGQGLTIGPAGGPGFSIGSGSLALPIIAPSAPAQNAGDARSWPPLTPPIAAASFLGGAAAAGPATTLCAPATQT